MKILLDSCIDRRVYPALQAAGHDADWVGLWPTDPGDASILRHAYQEGRILITLDNDFGELAIIQQIPHRGIVRLVNITAKDQAAFCLQVCQTYESDLLAGAIITVDTKRVRVRYGARGQNGH